MNTYLYLIVSTARYDFLFICEGGISYAMKKKNVIIAKRRKILFKKIGRRIAYYRKEKELTQSILAQQVGLSISTISRIERGQYNNNIPLTTLLDIADGLGIRLKDLLK